MDQIIYILFIAAIFLAGFACTSFFKKFNLPSTIILIVLGIILGAISKTLALDAFFPNQEFMLTIAIFFLGLVLFNNIKEVNIKHLDTNLLFSYRLAALFFLLSLSLLAIFTSIMFNIGIFFAMLFAVMMGATDLYLKKNGGSITEILKNESALGNSMAIIITLLIVWGFLNTGFLSFIQGILLGVGVGVLVYIIFSAISKEFKLRNTSTLFVIIALVVSYFGAELALGHGFFGIAAFGLLFGNSKLKQNTESLSILSTIQEFAGIIILVLIGYLSSINISFYFILKSLLLLIIFLAIRYISVLVTLQHSKFSRKEKLSAALNTPKGVTVAVIFFFLLLQNFEGLKEISSLTILFIIYTSLIHLIMSKFINKTSKPA